MSSLSDVFMHQSTKLVWVQGSGLAPAQHQAINWANALTIRYWGIHCLDMLSDI